MLLHNNYKSVAHSPSAGVPVLFVLTLLTAFNLGALFSAILFLIIAIVLVRLSIKTTLLTPVQLVIVAYVLAFPTVILLPDHIQFSARFTPSAEALEVGMLWSLRAFAMFALGYVLVDQYTRAKTLPGKGWSNEFLNRRTAHAIFIAKWAGLLAIVAFASNVVMQGGITMPGVTAGSSVAVARDIEPNTLQQILNLLTELRYPFFSIYLILRYYKQTNRTLTLIALILLTVSLLEFMVSGSKGDLIRILVSVFLAISLLPIRIGVSKILLGLVALVIVGTSFSVVSEYRSIMNKQYERRADISSFSVQLSSFQLAFSRTLGLSGSEELNTNVSGEDIASRFAASMFSFTNLLRFTDEKSPYENAWKSFLVPVYSVLPRSLAPGKPIFFNSGRNARDYYGWLKGGISVSMPGSLYFAWGFPGVLFGMFFLGCILAYMMKKIHYGDLKSIYWAIILMTLVMQLMDTGVTFQSSATNVIRAALLMGLFHLFYLKIQSRSLPGRKLPIDHLNTRGNRF